METTNNAHLYSHRENFSSFAAALLLGCLSLNAQYAPPSSGLVSWWRAEGTAVDSAGPNNGSLRAAADFAAGAYGQAFHFNGVNAHVWVPDSSTLDFTTGLTISAWINPDRLSPTRPLEVQDIVTKWDSFTTPQPWNQRSYLMSLHPNGQVMFGVSGNGLDVSSHVSSASAVPIHEWTHVAATFNGASLQIYLNGSLAGESLLAGSIFQGTRALSIGGTVGGAPEGAQITSPFQGAIDEVLLYSRALSLEEIQQLSVIPEPATGTLLLAGGVALAIARRRR